MNLRKSTWDIFGKIVILGVVEVNNVEIRMVVGATFARFLKVFLSRLGISLVYFFVVFKKRIIDLSRYLHIEAYFE